MAVSNGTKKLLVLDASYTLEMIRQRGLHEPILARDLNGYFEHVWSVNPFATVIPTQNKHETCGEMMTTRFAERHTILEGKVGRFRSLKNLFILNFLFSQIDILKALSRLIKKEEITAIRATDPTYLGLMGLMLARKDRIPLVVRVTGNIDRIHEETGRATMPRLLKWIWLEKKIIRFVLRRADLVAGANLDNLNFALANGARKDFSTVFRYGNLIHPSHRVPPHERPSADDILTELGLSGNMFAIYIGRLEPVKVPDHVILTIAELKKRGYNFKVLMIGDGSMKDELKIAAKKLNIEGNVVFAGNRGQEWIARVLPHAIFVLSPHTGRALAEAALSGVPIIAYDIDWQSELIKTGETGELVEYKNLSAMADAVIRVLNDPKYAQRIVQNVRKAATEMMDVKKLNDHERNEYEKLFARYYNNQSVDI
jgi:glycosyltransferase involved in cell wall biosynthesis